METQIKTVHGQRDRIKVETGKELRSPADLMNIGGIQEV